MAGSKRWQKLEKEVKRRKKLDSRRKNHPPSRDIVDQSNQLISRGQWEEAREILESYDDDRPDQVEVLRLLLDIYHAQRDFSPYCRTCRRLIKKEPDNRALYLMLAAGLTGAARPASSLLAFRRFVERWPNDPLADGARESIAQLELEVEKILREAPFPPAKKLELASLHEELLASLFESKYEEVIRLGEQLQASCPDFIPVLNNLSQGYYLAGRTEEALAASRSVLERDPDNFHALGNLARHLLLAGRHGEAQEACVRLRAVQSDNLESWIKKAETFAFFADDAAVLEMFEAAQRSGSTQEGTPDVALLFHLAAVACARQGNHRQAQNHWKHALKIYPGFDLAEENLADSKLPIGERHGPWHYSFNYYISETVVERLVKVFTRSTGAHDDKAVSQAALQFDHQHPEISSLVPLLLDRGDPEGREFAWRYANLLETPPMQEALRTFCLSQRGPDSLRIETANLLCKQGVLPPGPVRIWLQGKWQDTELMGFEITDEPTGPVHSPEVEAWAYEGMQAIRRGDGRVAAALFQKCIAAEGERPELLNNLAAAYEQQGKREDAFRLMRLIQERWPDYFFGRIALANQAAQDGKYDEAEAVLAPLRQRRRLHLTEFIALASAQIQLFQLQRKFEAARSWLAMFRDVAPDHPELARLERAVASSGLTARVLDGIAGLFGGRRNRNLR